MADAGVDVPALMDKLGNRMKLWHITDRGSRQKGPYITPILKEDEMELGYGNMDLKSLVEIAKKTGWKRLFWKLIKTGWIKIL